MLEVTDLIKTFGGLTAVRNVTTRFAQGQISAIIGPNGAGKSTFFNLIGGLHKPSGGRVVFDGRDVTTLGPDVKARLGIARTFQTTTLFDKATVRDNLIIGHRLRTRSTFWDVLLHTRRLRADEKACRDKAEAVLDYVGLGAMGDRLAGEISQEERKRVAFALALATEPKILLLDEPAGGINPEETVGLARLIRRIADDGITVCLIEHKMDMIMSLADKIVVLHHGELISDDTPEATRRNPKVIEAYLGASHAES